MLEPTHNYVNKLRESCQAMGKCRAAAKKAARVKSYGAEPDAIKTEVSTGGASSLDANLKG
jgi:hypothetical protein